MVNVAWAIDSVGAAFDPERCGSYKLQLYPSVSEPDFDEANMSVEVLDAHQFSFKTTEIVPTDNLFKTYNFDGWLESSQM